MAWWQRKRRDGSGPSGGQLRWRVEDVPGGGVQVSVELHGRIPGVDFPHLSALVLRGPHDGPLPEGWTAGAELGGSEADGTEIRVLTPLLTGPIRNLQPGGTFSATLPVPRDAVVGAVFGSLTNRLWVETASDHLWLLNHDRGPRLDDWANQIGTDPVVRRSRLVVEQERLRLEPIEEIRLSELRQRDGKE